MNVQMFFLKNAMDKNSTVYLSLKKQEMYFLVGIKMLCFGGHIEMDLRFSSQFEGKKSSIQMTKLAEVVAQG